MTLRISAVRNETANVVVVSRTVRRSGGQRPSGAAAKVRHG
eukprot:CAMPEP_0198315332 /NCGR_PEP_ID=MMETSP1450-20131203/5649_1 /TAXON_ID=753684 ORGANISM="Madagascaria erythrocladiodes, Strain CCMP3234" /NCGR_SAMPLE_ID=MMETSP1450 /ASSEMBLY_ACC=CAM_ASM_001115 /LENGTH=40 /DNA_ID= /DNA_START= /DNA_END= /DNA_ORIENTATION=